MEHRLTVSGACTLLSHTAATDDDDDDDGLVVAAVVMVVGAGSGGSGGDGNHGSRIQVSSYDAGNFWRQHHSEC